MTRAVDLRPRIGVTVDLHTDTLIETGDPRVRGTQPRRCVVLIGGFGLNAVALAGTPATMRRLAEAALTVAVDVEKRLTEGKAAS